MPPEAAVLLGRGPALLERAVGYTRGCLMLASGADPHASTPCSRWDLVTLLEHMDDSLAAFAEAAEAGRVALPDAVSAAAATPGRGGAMEATAGAAAGGTDTIDAETAEVALGMVLRSLRERACALLAAWAADQVPPVRIGKRRLDSDLLAAVGSLEITVHGWDVSTACGAPRPIPEALAGTLLAVADLVLEESEEGRFAQAVDVPEDADAATRLLARLGRTCP